MEDPKITGFLVKRDFGSCGDPPFEETLTSCGRPKAYEWVFTADPDQPLWLKHLEGSDTNKRSG